MKLRKLRIGLADQYGGSMPSGWTRFLLEQFEFPFEVVYPKTLDAGNLSSKFDVLIFLGRRPGAGGGRAAAAAAEAAAGCAADGAFLPSSAISSARYTAAQTVPQLQEVPRGRRNDPRRRPLATNLGRLLGLPIDNHLVERTPDGSRGRCRREVLRARFDPAGWPSTTPRRRARPGGHVDVFFDNSPVFTLEPDAALKGVRPVAWFDIATPLRSGWAYGQGYLNGGVSGIDARSARAGCSCSRPEITFRAQPHGTFKFLFNGILCWQGQKGKRR